MDFEGIGNVTTRKGHDLQKPKMARGAACDLGGSLLLESILSQDETKDVLTMMIAADEYDGHNQIPSFCTSTQMGGRDQRRRPISPPLSPMGSPDALNMTVRDGRIPGDNKRDTKDGDSGVSSKESFLNLKNSFDVLDVSYGFSENSQRTDDLPVSGPWISKNRSESDRPESGDLDVDMAGGDGVAKAGNLVTIGDVKFDGGQPGNVNKTNGDLTEGVGKEVLVGGPLIGDDVKKDDDASDDNTSDVGEQLTDKDEPQTDLAALLTKLGSVDEFMERIDKRLITLT